MPYNDYFIFNGVKSTDMGLHIANDPTSEIPARRGDEIIVPGRNGIIVQEDGSFSTYTQTYDVVLDAGGKAADVYAQARQIAAWLLGSRGFCRLEDSFEPDYFRLARCADALSIEKRLARFGRAKINFDCQPQRYLKTGEAPYKMRIANARQYISMETIPDGVSSVRLDAYGTNILPASGAGMRVYNLADDSVGVDVDMHDVDGDGLHYSGSVTIENDYNAVSIQTPMLIRSKLTFVYSDGEEIVPLTSDGFTQYTLLNPVDQNAWPLIHFKATGESGTASVMINGVSAAVTLSGGQEIYLDSDLHDAYYPGGGNANAAVSFSSETVEYPTFQPLVPGENTVSFIGTENYEAEIIPRWWVL